ncbi:DUF4399 domain-containing protein [Thalassotalea sp. PLHSN55]|uniref:DUF4399 domain-containing protein n=1 Tax=Thalassotalea sp. PLHSN55 TaxID=3435888 RepID=UPI003F85C6B8
MKKSLLLASLLLANISPMAMAHQHEKAHAPKASVYIISPQNGATVSSPVKVTFGLSGMGVAPAGVERKNTGHHHILIDTDTLPDLTKPLPATDKIKHFGGGQTETTLNLSPGKHTLQLVLGNHAHVPHKQPVMSKKITITVK